MNLMKLLSATINPLFFLLNDLYCELSSVFPGLFKRSPLVLRIRITSKCNLRCGFCYLKEGLNNKGGTPLTLAEWEAILTPLPKRTIIDITGAEPLAADHFIEFTELLSKLGFRYSVTTNGTLYDTHTAEALVKNGVSLLMISLDGLPDTHNRLRGSSTAFERTVKFIQDIERAKIAHGRLTPLINIKSTVLDSNHDDLANILHFCNNQFNVGIFTFTLYFQNRARGGMKLANHFMSPTLQSGNTATYAKSQEVFHSIVKILKQKRAFPFPIVFKPRLSSNHLRHYLEDPSRLKVKHCPKYKNNLTLYHDGTVSPCDIGLKLGNIREFNYRLDAVYNSSNFADFTKNMKPAHPACQGCCAGKHST